MKKVINTALFAALIAGVAVTAQADPNTNDIQIDMYGASAQRDFWKDLGHTFMTFPTTEGGMGCANAYKSVGQKLDTDNTTIIADSNRVVIKGDNCGVNGGSDVYITYTSVASLEGVRAAKEVAPVTTESCATANVKNRKIANPATCTSVPWYVIKLDNPATPDIDEGGKFIKLDSTGRYVLYVAGTNQVGTRYAVGTDGRCTANICADIELGTSDVEGESFSQASRGNLTGHIADDVTDADISLTPETIDATTMKSYKPTVVPFAFYANNDLGGATPAAPLNNLTRTQALNLFSGSVYDWGQLNGFGAYAGKGVQICLRHAGSGTHATLDKAVMRGDLNLIQDEGVNGVPGEITDAFFYQSSDSSSGGMKQCIETNGGNGVGGDYIAIGYLDADAAATTNMHQLKYQGASATDTDIANGSYDFWSAQNVYLKKSDDSATVVAMMKFAAANVPSSKAGIWVKANDLKVQKLKDTDIPVLQ
ncbi:MAG: hypothetical protein J0652_01375 [Desulfobulbaceae bacterium]|nr:hypothetical protein [Desulfobulbaceae bacterium]